MRIESQPDTKPDTKTIIGLFVILLGTIAGIFFIVAGFELYSHGQNLVDLRSVASQTGDTSIMEVYYNEMGYYGQAYALAAFATGGSVIAISVGLGALLTKKSILKIGNWF